MLRGFSLKRPIKAISRKVVFFLRLLLLELTLSGVVADNPFPDWFTFNGTDRSRVEVLDGQFRPSLDGGDQLVAFRTTLALRVERETFDAEFELMDSRQSLSDRGTPLGTDDVNSLALLQASIGVGLQDYLGTDAVSFRLGRQTMDLGGRRLIARNRFRNTVNSFTGLSAQWYRGKDLRLNCFYFLPVSRRPSGFNRLIDHDIQIDQESFSRRLWGLHGERSGLWFDSVGEAYLVRLDESDTIREPSKNRKLLSPGLRWLRRSKVGQFDFDIEGVGQFGQSRATFGG